MLHLLSKTVNPDLRLSSCLQRWFEISMGLRESPRKRLMQTEYLKNCIPSVEGGGGLEVFAAW